MTTVEPIVMQPAYLSTDGGQLHLRWGGSGPAVVLLHDVPGSAASVDATLVEALMQSATVIAPDLIGSGGTTVDDARAGDLDAQAMVLAAALRSAGVSSAPVVGDGVGAAVARRMAELFPELVTAVLVLSEPSATLAEAPELPAPDVSGSHLLRLFDEIRNSFTFRPSWQPRRENRRPGGLPDPSTLHTVLLDTAEHGDAHRRVLAAAAAFWAARESAPASGDPIAEALALPAGRGEPDMTRASGDPRAGRAYVSTSIGPVHLRQVGDPSSSARPILLLHANPGSGKSLEPLARALGGTRRAIVWDTPGHGRSAALRDDADPPTLAGTYAPLLVEVLDALGVAQCDVYGTHTGAGLAAELAILAPERIGAVVLDGVPLFDDQPELVAAVMDHYFVDLVPDTHGSHIRRAWGATWDMALWWPWFNQTAEGIRDVDAYAPAFIHGVVLDMLRSAPHYYRSYQAAWLWQCTQRLLLVRRPVLVGSTRTDPLAPMTAKAMALLGDRATEAVFHPLSAAQSVEDNAELIATYLDAVDAR